nr:MAG TPA: hypothetical protein [Bacteriophage sp.]
MHYYLIVTHFSCILIFTFGREEPMTRKETLKNEIVMIGSGKSAPFYLLTEKTDWTKVSFVGSSNSVDEAISSKKCANVPNTAKEITVDITVKRNSATTIKFSQSIKTYGEYCGGYYNSDKYYASYQIVYRRDIIMLYKSWLKVVDNGAAYDNSDTVQVDVYYR